MKTFQNTKNYPFTPQHIEIEGVKMAYLDEGPKDAPVIIMLHGNPSWSYLYRNLVLHLMSRFRCIVPDHIGCGNSDKPQDYSNHLESHVSNVEKLIDHLQVESFSLVVHDWGGAIGFGCATRRNELLKRFIVLTRCTKL